MCVYRAEERCKSLSPDIRHHIDLFCPPIFEPNLSIIIILHNMNSVM